MAEYNRYSPYKNTPQTWYLDRYVPITMYPASDDSFYTIPSKYHQKPWMLAKEVYGEERLHYIFALLNMDILKDPLYDFREGVVIRVPSYERVQRIIGGG